LEQENARLREKERILLNRLQKSKEKRRREKTQFRSIFDAMVERMVEQETRLQKVGWTIL
jgi:hypothetical protein